MKLDLLLTTILFLSAVSPLLFMLVTSDRKDNFSLLGIVICAPAFSALITILIYAKANDVELNGYGLICCLVGAGIGYLLLSLGEKKMGF